MTDEEYGGGNDPSLSVVTGRLPVMPYDEELANRLREALQREDGISERRMFGGLAFLVDGHLAVAASRQGGLLLRVHPAHTETLLGRPGTAPFVMRGRELEGWLHVRDDALTSDAKLREWVQLGLDYVHALPAKG